MSSFVESQKRQAKEVFGMARAIVDGMQPQKLNNGLNHGAEEGEWKSTLSELEGEWEGRRKTQGYSE